MLTVRIDRANFLPVAAAAAVVAMLVGAAWAKPERTPPSPPDLTQPGEIEKVDRKLTFNLGATGLRGWMHHKPATHFDGLQGRTTDLSRQILVTHVGKGSPADGVLEVGDVILGAGGGLFEADARKSFARAIQQAETEAAGGVLKMTIWRAGETKQVQIKLRVLGSYSATAPYDCPKSKLILEDACKALAKERLEVSWHGMVNALAMMASGKEEFLPLVRELAHKMSPADLKLPEKGFGTWDTGFRGIFLCEYYMLTGDPAVKHAVNEYTLCMARGQGMYGTFGHGFSARRPDGGLHGPVPPYGPVNQAGLIANIAIVLGKKAGVKDPEVDAAVKRASQFFGYFVDKGSIPYGEHEPWPYHDNNGKCAMSALLFGLQAGRPAEANFFARMATAGYRSRECGHTGQGFSYLWGALGANVGGPSAVAAFFQQASWHLDLVRRCDGTFTYDGGEQYGPGRTDDNTYYGKSSYSGLSPNATYVLTYSLPLRKLNITGKGADKASWLSGRETAETIAAGAFDLDRKQMNVEQLIGAFTNWSPVVRGWAAEELAARPEAKGLAGQLIEMTSSKDPHIRQCAAEALGQIKSPEALPALVGMLDDSDRWARFKAAGALKQMGDAASPGTVGMLKAIIETAEPSHPIVWADPVQISQGQLASALFKGPLRGSIRGIDPNTLHTAIRAVLNYPDGRARGWLSDTFKQLSLEDVEALAPDLLAAIKEPAPANTMFADVIRGAAMGVLAKYRFKEAIPLCITTMEIHGWGKRRRIASGLEMLRSYGGAAKEVLPLLDQLEQELLAHREANGLKEFVVQLRELREYIKNDKEFEPVRCLQPKTRPRDMKKGIQ